MTALVFTIDGPPVPKERPRVSFATGRVYTPVRTRSYEKHSKAVAFAACAKARWKTATWSTCAIVVEVDVYFQDARRRDADNVCKSLFDSWNGVIYADDSQIVEATVRKHIDRARPRVEVKVRPAT